jgi:hypothetical protein
MHATKLDETTRSLSDDEGEKNPKRIQKRIISDKNRHLPSKKISSVLLILS